MAAPQVSALTALGHQAPGGVITWAGRATVDIVAVSTLVWLSRRRWSAPPRPIPQN